MRNDLYRTVETNERVVGVDPELVTRWRWRAVRRCRKLNIGRLVDFYRYEVHPLGKKWEVVAMQNRAEPVRGYQIGDSDPGITREPREQKEENDNGL